MAGKIKAEEKDESPHVIDCGDCTGESPKPGNSTCANCIARMQKAGNGTSALAKA